jgi:hypothetical protein
MTRVVKVIATVHLGWPGFRVVEETVETNQIVTRMQFGEPRAGDQGNTDNHLRLLVRLATILDTGRRIDAKRWFGISGPRRGGFWHRYHGPPLNGDREERNRLLEATYRVGQADIEDGIDVNLGRGDPRLHSPWSGRAWGPLIAALAGEGIEVDENELIQAPLTVELDDEVAAELEAE